MIYVIGEYLGTGSRHLTSRRLAHLCGVSEETLLGSVVWLNLFDTPGTNSRLTVDMVERAAESSDAILLLGRRVARAWALDDLPPLGVVMRNAGQGPLIALIPHPSGLNRWWNDPEHEETCGHLLTTLWIRYGRT